MAGAPWQARLGAALGLLVALGLPSRLPAADDPTPYCGAADHFDSLEQQDLGCLNRLSRIARRKGNALVLHLDGGATKTIKSNPDACEKDDADNCVRNYLVGYHEGARLFIVVKTYYEGWEYLLISARTGTETSLGDQPHFAPDGSTFVVVDSQEENAQPYYLAVGTVATDPPSISWKNSKPVAGEWDFKRWIDRDHIGLKVMTVTPNCPEPECEAVLTRLAKGWKLELLPPKK